jgi:hypothetical protein
MGRPNAEVDLKILEDLLLDVRPKKEIATLMGVSLPTLRKVINNVQDKKTILTQYEVLRGLHLTEMQVMVLERALGKIDEASFKDLMTAYKILGDKKIQSEEEKKDDDLKGLVAHLLHLERLERELGRPVDITDISDSQEAEYEREGIPLLPDPETGI